LVRIAVLSTKSPAARSTADGISPGFIMGTAVVPFGTPVENVPDVKQAGLDAASP